MAPETRARSRSRAATERSDRAETPEPGPAEYGPYDVALMGEEWEDTHVRFWRELAYSIPDRDVCQLCNKVGHHAVQCPTFVSQSHA